MLFMHTGTLRKMPEKLAGARRASREDTFPTRLEYAANAAHGTRSEQGKNISPARFFAFNGYNGIFPCFL